MHLSLIITRIASAAIVLLLAALAGANAIANYARERNPQLALAVRPNDAVALATFGRSSVLSGLSPKTIEQASAFARRALMAEPLSAVALETLGMAVGAGRDTPVARQFVELADVVSRRDFRTQMWFVTASVAANDAESALEHYDVALSTDRASEALLFPTLNKAIADPEIAAAVVPYIREQRPWIAAFVNNYLNSGSNPSALAYMLISAGGLPEGEHFNHLEASLLRKLIAADQFAAARRFAIMMNDGDSKALDSFGFDQSTTQLALAPLTWQLTETAETQAYLGADNSLRLSFMADRKDRIASRIVFLSPGRHDLNIAVRGDDTSTTAQLEIAVSCSSNSTVLGKVVTGFAHTAAEPHLAFTVPPNCPSQEIIITVSGNGDKGISAASIHKFTLR